MKKTVSIAMLTAVFLAPVAGFAAWQDALKPTRWELRTGYAFQYTNSKRPNNFEFIPLLPSVSVPIGDPVGSGGLRGQFEWNPELFLALFIHPYMRTLFGVTPLQFRYVFETKYGWKPYLFAGAGILCSDIDRRETGNRLNFNPQFGAGLYYALGDATSLIFEYRHIHISNAGMDERNAGLNTHTFLLGVSLKK